jgi:hypothetical protein
MKFILLLSAVTVDMAACSTIEERMAKRTGCDVKGVTVQEEMMVPGYQSHFVTCRTEHKKYKCKDAPAFSRCDEIIDSGNGATRPPEKPPVKKSK